MCAGCRDGRRRHGSRADHLTLEDDLDTDRAASTREAIEIDLCGDEETARRRRIDEELRRRTARAEKLADVRRTIAIVVDDLGLSFESTHFVRRALKKFVDEQMQTGDLVAIIRTGGADTRSCPTP